MRQMMFCAFLSLALIGCAGQQPPSSVQIAGANYGSLPANYQEQIKSYFGSVLKDPYTAHYAFDKPFKGYSQDGAWAPSGGKVFFGWVAPVNVNARNSYGGYTGNKPYVFIFSEGQLYDTTINATYGRVKPVVQ